MAVASPSWRPRSPDLLGACVLFSLLVHGILLFGLAFRQPPAAAAQPGLDVTILQTSNALAPDHAEFLAQSNNQGGGNSEHTEKPSQLFAGELPTPQPGMAPQPVPASLARAEVTVQQQRLTTTGDSPDSVSDQDSHSLHDTEHADADETRREQEMASLAAELDQRNQAYAKRPRKKFISANTREYAYASYMQHWVRVIERSGNLNYPAVARQRHLYGELILSVGLHRDGHIASIDVIRPSGHPELDQAAARIVRQAGPFPALPPDRHRVDLLYITRTWQFLPGDHLNTH